MRYAKRLDKASTVFFFLGFAIGKLRNAPFVVLSTVFRVLSLSFYLIGNILWLIACHYYPDHPRLQQSWYSFFQFKDQHKTAAIFGALAIIGTFLAFAFPIALIPACWLFALSNCFWLIGEYHKKVYHENPNQQAYEKEYSSQKQAVFLNYALFTTATALFSALATTLVFFFPPAALIIIPISSLIVLGLTALAVRFLLEYNFTEFTPDSQSLQNTSYQNMLSNGLTAQVKNEICQAPITTPSLFTTIPIPDPIPLSETSLNPSP